MFYCLGDKVKVQNITSMQEVEVKKDVVEQMNPPKFEMANDMANMTYLSEATVLHNLKTRYVRGFIYVSLYLQISNIFVYYKIFFFIFLVRC